MKLSIRLSIILMLMTPILGGCWNSRELNELAIASAIGIDKIDGQYQITVQIINPNEVSKEKAGRRTAVTTQSASGKTLFEAFRKMTTETSKKIFVSHVRILVIGEDLAREGISKLLDLLFRDHEFRSSFNVLIAKDEKASDILSILTSMDEIPGDKLYTSLRTSSHAYGTTLDLTLADFMSNMSGKGKNAVVSGVIIVGDKEQGRYDSNYSSIKPEVFLKLVPLSVFKGDQLIDWMDSKESRGYNFAEGNIKSTLVNVPCVRSKGVLGVEVLRSDAKITAKREDTGINGHINVKIKGNAMDDECTKTAKLDETTYIAGLEHNMEQYVKAEILSTVEKSQKDFRTDIFGLGEAYHRANPKDWKKIEKRWDELYPDVPITVQVQTEIVNTGSITNSPQSGG